MSRKIYWGKKGRNGMLEYWNNGVMEYWSGPVCHIEGVIECPPRLRGDIPRSIRVPELCRGFLLPLVVEMTNSCVSYRRSHRLRYPTFNSCT